jgi:hypothetical protein
VSPYQPSKQLGCTHCGGQPDTSKEPPQCVGCGGLWEAVGPVICAHCGAPWDTTIESANRPCGNCGKFPPVSIEALQAERADEERLDSWRERHIRAEHFPDR